jgi:hypothetical protein
MRISIKMRIVYRRDCMPMPATKQQDCVFFISDIPVMDRIKHDATYSGYKLSRKDAERAHELGRGLVGANKAWAEAVGRGADETENYLKKIKPIKDEYEGILEKAKGPYMEFTVPEKEKYEAYDWIELDKLPKTCKATK